MTMEQSTHTQARYGMVIDLDSCDGCGACMVSCAVENNVAPAHPSATERTGITWMNVIPVASGDAYPRGDVAFVPMFCQQCEEETPCMAVCPQNAVEIDPATGIVGQIPQRCLGCRYCMTACPYHARYFNWRDPAWPAGMETELNPAVAPRMRGVAEKCNFCHGRLHAAKAKAAAQGKQAIDPADYVPACVEACPRDAIVFGDLNDPTSEVSRLAAKPDTFRFLSRLGTEPKVSFHSTRAWVKELAEHTLSRTVKELAHG
jgi:molybdopterin-containing oxidoreductase family iron-sulfur binding subunit